MVYTFLYKFLCYVGIFSPGHMPYEIVRDSGPTGAPSLTEMTTKALQILKKNQNGFVLVVIFEILNRIGSYYVDLKS